MLTILGDLAESERELIRSRTSEGRAHAVARGGGSGRKLKLTHDLAQEAQCHLAAGAPVREIACGYAVLHSAITRLAEIP